MIALTGAIIEVPAMTSTIPSLVGGFTGGPGPASFLGRYASEVARLRDLSLPPPTLFSPFCAPARRRRSGVPGITAIVRKLISGDPPARGPEQGYSS
jgi:hypothetical protein